MTERRLSPLTMLAALASTALWVVAIAVPTAVLLGVLVTPWAALWVAAGAALVLGCAGLVDGLVSRIAAELVAQFGDAPVVVVPPSVPPPPVSEVVTASVVEVGVEVEVEVVEEEVKVEEEEEEEAKVEVVEEAKAEVVDEV